MRAASALRRRENAGCQLCFTSVDCDWPGDLQAPGALESHRTYDSSRGDKAIIESAGVDSADERWISGSDSADEFRLHESARMRPV
ncbi:MAG: hypothetical protein DWI00_17000 [Planctomycetota bacterium]|nr:MAG: hypothetical protein DWI00_17000 [Planctomycetota bacterium]